MQVYTLSNLFHLKFLASLPSMVKTLVLLFHTPLVQELHTYRILLSLMDQSGIHKLFTLQQRLLGAKLTRHLIIEGLLIFKRHQVSCFDLLEICQDEFALK